MPRRIILLNGPPRSGKDEAAKIILEKHNTSQSKSAEIIRLADPLLQYLYSSFPQVIDYEAQKADPICDGLTPRQCIINYAENVMKPNYGNDVFVNIAIDRIKNSENSIFVVPDFGFDEEFNGFIKFAQNYGDIEIILIKMYRTGRDFRNDSRKYVKIDEKYKIKQLNVYNNGTLLELKNKIHEEIANLEKIYEAPFQSNCATFAPSFSNIEITHV